MEIDYKKIDEAALALLFLTVHEGDRAWKQLDWDILDRLHQNELILDPVNKSSSVIFTEAGLKLAEHSFNKLFSR